VCCGRCAGGGGGKRVEAAGVTARLVAFTWGLGVGEMASLTRGLESLADCSGMSLPWW
jgi:hypothetical protein